MKVSFVIPTRNQAGFLRRCLDTCLAQRIADAEILVVDGASSDGTQDVLRSYGERISWVSEPDRGQSDALNKGIARATGEVIAWINSDDWYPDEGAVPAVLEAFASVAGVDLVYGRATIVDERGSAIRPHRTHRIRSAKDVLLLPTGPCMQPATFFRRDLFLSLGGLDTGLHYAMDYDLWLRMFPRARAFLFVDRVLACATFHPSAKSIAGMRHQVRELALLKRRHRPAFALGTLDRLRLSAGVAELWLYWAAVKTGMRHVG